MVAEEVVDVGMLLVCLAQILRQWRLLAGVWAATAPVPVGTDPLELPLDLAWPALAVLAAAVVLVVAVAVAQASLRRQPPPTLVRWSRHRPRHDRLHLCGPNS